jgi:tetratricopeptide (TPR) repeat protein
MARRYDEATQQLRKTLDLEPTFGVVHHGLSELYEAQGKYAEARAERIKTAQIWGDDIANFFRQPGAKGYWQALLQYHLQLERRQYVLVWLIAADYVGIGDKDKAFESLEKGYQEHDDSMANYLREPAFDGPISFTTALIARVGVQKIQNRTHPSETPPRKAAAGTLPPGSVMCVFPLSQARAGGPVRRATHSGYWIPS